MSIHELELLSGDLRRSIDPSSLKTEDLEGMAPLDGVVGQKRAVAALELGLGTLNSGFNVYVSGPPGLGKMTAVKTYLEKFARTRPTPTDWCYVNNFDDPYLPGILELPAGKGRELQLEMKAFLDQVRRDIARALESEEYAARKEEVVRGLETQKTESVQSFNERANREGFVVQATPMGIAIVPVIGNRAMTDTEFQQMSAQEKSKLQQKQESLQSELQALTKQVRQIEREAHEKLRELDRKMILYIVGDHMDDLLQKFAELPPVIEYLKSVQNAMSENMEFFKTKHEENPLTSLREPDLQYRKYQVNVLVDNSKQDGAPVVVELNPSYSNLFGRVEKETLYGALHTDFTLIKAGSLHRANGGYIVLEAYELLRNPFSWDGLKRMLSAHEIQIEDIGDRLGLISSKGLRPMPVPLRIKAILVGPPVLYHLLLMYDPDFSELFKVKAEFDTRMDRNGENIQAFLGFLNVFGKKESIAPLDASAVARILEHASRLAEDKEKLSTHFGIVADTVREANYWAAREGVGRINASHVQKAIDERKLRSNLIQERMQEMMVRGLLKIETSGKVVGQVNGLSVYSLGDYAFGRPSRITASVVPGRDGVLDIEREVKLGGPIHSKGVMILSGYLAQKFAADRPLTLSARLVFEQSYEGVEGDSASSTELYSLLSALSGLPIDQGIAVTGSINQRGEVQAIGGANEKIEGFFDLCKTRGLTGSQGVMIPQSNVQNLMLREEVVEAVRERKFHVWAVTSIDQGIEVLTGIPAGERGTDGNFSAGTVNHLVQRRLHEFSDALKKEEPPLSTARKNADEQ